MSLHSLGCVCMGTGLGIVLGIVYSPTGDEKFLMVCAAILLVLGMVASIVRHPHIVGK